jgi:hypothetical protein
VNGEWKAATILAGSLVEALLLWGLDQKGQSAISSVVKGGTLASKPAGNYLDWNLWQYLEVAAAIRIIEQSTSEQIKIAKDFRNLIHPGRSIKKQLVCDRGTAAAASAAVEFVMRDLKANFP